MTSILFPRFEHDARDAAITRMMAARRIIPRGRTPEARERSMRVQKIDELKAKLTEIEYLSAQIEKLTGEIKEETLAAKGPEELAVKMFKYAETLTFRVKENVRHVRLTVNKIRDGISAKREKSDNDE
jgi:predicted transcriptional regulator